MRRLAPALLALALPLASWGSARADEGQWTPDQLAELDQAALKALGLELSPAQLWDAKGDERSGGLMRAAVNYGGCSAAFISPEGLIATNHHCAYAALQANSTPEHDYLRDGFLAPKREDELEARGRPLSVLRRMEDVTTVIAEAAEAAGDDDAARWRAIERAEKELVKTCEASAGARCTVASFYNGSQYRLFEYLELPDVRLVFAPPSSVGEYGGEVDNWMWPRHTGDFSLLRAYVGPDGQPAEHASENVPYRPGQHLKVSAEGVSPGDFVAVLGYPGRTQRYMPAPEVARWVDQVLPLTVDLYGEWIELLEHHGARDAAVKIKVAATKKGLANRHKNARGMLDGIDHMKLIERRKAEDEALAAWVAEGHEAHADVLPALEALSAEARRDHLRDTLLGALARGPNSLAIAIDLVRRADAQNKPDLERPSAYMERSASTLWKTQQRRIRDFDAAVDAELLAMFMARNAALDPEARIGGLIGVSGEGTPGDRSSYLAAGKALVDGTGLGDAATVEKLWKASGKELARNRDPMIVLARALAEELSALEEREAQTAGRKTRIYPRYFEMLEAVRKGPIYPDANGTLRMSYATVKGYDKWDGARQVPQTVLAGALAKHTGTEPFDLPEVYRERAPGAAQTYWADPDLGDLPLCFLSTADTTGGNSGSPVINGRGEFVGLNFDRVWENIAGDFGYNPGHSRNITVDVRFLLWVLDDVVDAAPLLEEMGVADKRGAPARAATKDAAAEPATAAAAQPAKSPKKRGCGCDAGGGASGGGAGLLLLSLFGFMGLARGARRRHRDAGRFDPPARR